MAILSQVLSDYLYLSFPRSEVVVRPTGVGTNMMTTPAFFSLMTVITAHRVVGIHPALARNSFNNILAFFNQVVLI